MLNPGSVADDGRGIHDSEHQSVRCRRTSRPSGGGFPGRSANNDLELLKEEETVSIASRYEQPISQAPSNVYVVTDEDIRQSGATDLPTVLRRIPGLKSRK